MRKSEFIKFKPQIRLSAINALSLAAAALLVLVISALLMPVHVPAQSLGLPETNGIVTEASTTEPNTTDSVSLAPVESYIRPNLFRVPTRLRNQPKADKTVDKILSLLKLRCVTSVGDKPVAYVSIKGVGLRSCNIGDSVEDKFRVLDIGDKSIDIEIAGQKVVLGL